MSDTNDVPAIEEGEVYSIAAVRKADTAALITNGTDSFPADNFAGSYWTGQGGPSSSAAPVAILEPVFKPGVLWALVTQNNTLLQCIEAMEVNIDGTGHSIDLTDEQESEPKDDPEKSMLEDFFREPYPGKSMVEIRRAVRRDLESTGNGYMEVIRGVDDTVVLLNSLDAENMRLVRLDDPVLVTKELVRGGKDLKVQLRSRERRFVQNVNGTKVFFKEFGASRDLDRDTGLWAKPGARLPMEKRASEVIHFTGNKEAKTPYGGPRWINQLPAVLGSRKAEEHNLEFFDGGGIPPVLVIIEGGTLGERLREDLKRHLTGQGGKSRAAIVEAISTSGTIDSAGSVRVRVERFGAERQQDSMFQSYDKDSAEHVRMAFRIPAIFIGKAADYNFATAYTAYMVAEAQVFAPERQEFDARINHTVVKALGAKRYRFRSLPLTLTDIANQLKALELAMSNKIISGQESVTKLNEVTGLSMEYTEPPAPEPPPVTSSPATSPDGNPTTSGDPNAVGAVPAAIPVTRPVKKEEQDRLSALALEWIAVVGVDGEEAQSLYSETAKDRIFKAVADLSPAEAQDFHTFVAAHSLKASGLDLPGLAELCACCQPLVER